MNITKDADIRMRKAILAYLLAEGIPVSELGKLTDYSIQGYLDGTSSISVANWYKVEQVIGEVL